MSSSRKNFNKGYALSVLGAMSFPFFLSFLPTEELPEFLMTLVAISDFCVFPFYCVIPQFFIARWLAKEAEDGTMESNNVNE